MEKLTIAAHKDIHLQIPTLGVLIAGYRPRTANRTLVHRSQGGRHRAEGCMALR
jgi:hypothetical protein